MKTFSTQPMWYFNETSLLLNLKQKKKDKQTTFVSCERPVHLQEMFGNFWFVVPLFFLNKNIRSTMRIMRRALLEGI